MSHSNAVRPKIKRHTVIWCPLYTGMTEFMAPGETKIIKHHSKSLWSLGSQKRWVIIDESLSMSHNLWIIADGRYEAWNIDFLFDHHSLNIHVNNHVVMFLTAVEPMIIQKPIVYSTGKNVLFINLCPLGSEKVNWK